MNDIPQAPSYLTILYEEAHKVREAIRAWGGGFMVALGNAMDHADRNNLAKIRTTWRKEWDEYLQMYEAQKLKQAQEDNDETDPS